MWCEQYKSKKSTLSHETKVQFRPLAVYHIFHKTDTYSLFSLYEQESIVSNALKKKFEKKLKKILEKKFGKKIWKQKFGKKIWKQKFGKKIWKKILGKKFEKKYLKKKFEKKNLVKKIWKKIIKKKFGKKFWQQSFEKINYKTKIFIGKIYSNIDKCHTIFFLLAPFDKTGRKTRKASVVYDSK